MFAGIRILSFLGACCLLSPAAGASANSARVAQTSAPRQTAQVQSVSGRITSIVGNTITLETTASQNGAHDTVTFAIDQDTVVEGRIEAGSKADVTYRRQDGNNIAVSVRISSQS